MEAAHRELPRATLLEALAFLAIVVLPTFAMGPIRRRSSVLGLLERSGGVDRAISFLHGLRERHGVGPVMFTYFRRRYAIVLTRRDARLVLQRTPDPFATQTTEKRSAISHFAPANSLISSGVERSIRRQVSDRVLESHRPTHSHSERFRTIMADAARACGAPVLQYNRFSASWATATRRIVLGEAASNDDRLTEVLLGLRENANWAFLRPKSKRRVAQYQQNLSAYLDQPGPGSLVQLIGDATPSAAPVDQVSQWLFAFDAAGIATWRALALVVAHDATEQARGRTGDTFRRAAILEALRLWPTTPAILREAVGQTRLADHYVREGTSFIIFVPFMHRADDTPEVHQFHPERQLGPEDESSAMLAFSFGPGQCPAHYLVPLIGSLFIESLLERGDLRLDPPTRLGDLRRLPAALDFATVVFRRSTS